MTIGSNSAGQTTISDVIVKGDTYRGFTAIVKESEDLEKQFTGTQAQITLRTLSNKYSGSSEIYNAALIVDEDTLGQVSVSIEFPPSLTETLPVETIEGDIKFTFTDEIADEPLVKTAFVLLFQIVVKGA